MVNITNMNMYEENIKTIETFSTVLKIKELLANGYTWFKKNDLGYGSIQEYFNAADVQIAIIRKNPLLCNLETIARVFVIKDDTKENGTTTTTTVSADNKGDAVDMECIPEPDKREAEQPVTVYKNSDGNAEEKLSDRTVTADESANAFFNI